MRQMNFDSKIDEYARKPESHITRHDARKLHATEASSPMVWSMQANNLSAFQGRAFNKRPGRESASAQVRSIADRNESLSLPPESASIPAQNPQANQMEDAELGQQIEAQHPESQSEGPLPRQSISTELQVSGPFSEKGRLHAY